MTPIQLATVRFIAEYISAHGYSPTLAEIAAERNVSKVSAFECVDALVKQKFLKRKAFKARSLDLTDKGRAALSAIGACSSCGSGASPGRAREEAIPGDLPHGGSPPGACANAPGD